ncbi:multiple C2 and transmembrane domain-containing protein 1-like isoform X7 [Crassostrea virginica]
MDRSDKRMRTRSSKNENMDSSGKEKEKKKWSLRRFQHSFLKKSDEEYPLRVPEESSRRAKSSIDLSSTPDSRVTSPPSASKRRFWGSFRLKSRGLRYRQKRKNQEKGDGCLSISQPDINTSRFSDEDDIHNSRGSNDFDHLFSSTDTASPEKGGPDRSVSDPDVSPIKGNHNKSSQRSRSQSAEEREDEGDSGIAVIETSQTIATDTGLRQRRHELMQHSFFHLDVWLKEGKDLVVRDSSGTSDPYVKFKIGDKQFYKSRTVYKCLNPKWDERFTIPIEDVFKPVSVKCYDYDRGVKDDRMGAAEINLSMLSLNSPTELKLELKDKKDDEYMGFILLQCTLVPKSSEEKEQFQQTRGSTLKKSVGSLESQARKLKMQIWSGIVNIVLVEGHDLMAMDDNGLSDPYVKFRLGQEKYKSKHKYKTLNPRWLEQFSLRIFDDQSHTLEISVYDHDLRSDDFMGRTSIDLSEIEKEKTHMIIKELEDGAGTIKLLLTISGTQGAETITDLVNYTTNTKERDDLYRSYGLVNSFKNLKDVGWLQVKVIRAQGLRSADIGGKSDPFCVLELVNARLQTQTEYKTLNPEWNKIFTFNVKDIHSVLEVTVYDEDRDKKAEFLGKVAIPILQMKRGVRRWYALKDKKLTGRSKGAILLEMDYIYNPVKAAVRTVNPREEKYMQAEPKFKISLMKRNINRVMQIISSIMEVGKFLQSCFEWESKARSITAFTVFLIITWFFEPYMLPVTLLILFLKNYFIKSAKEAFSVESREDLMSVDEEDDDDDDETSKQKKV